MNLATLEQDAAALLGPTAAEYVARGDDAANNTRAWQRLSLRPHVLRDVSNVTTATSVLGIPVASPVLVAPTAMHALVHADAERATARAAAAAGTVMCVSMASSCSLEEIANVAPDAPRFAQMYVLRDRGRTRALAERAATGNYCAIVVSVDGGAVPYGASTRAPAPLTPRVQGFVDDFDPSVTADDLARVADWSGLPLVVKGVMRADDARECIDAGARAIYVSNHGGRICPDSVDTASAVADVVAGVDGRAEVYVDGGIRSGIDVLRALALGAHAVLVGRPVLWGLAVDGEAGVFTVLEALRVELVRTMAFCGVAHLGEVRNDLITLR